MNRRTAVRALGVAGMGLLLARPAALFAAEPAWRKGLEKFKPQSHDLLAKRLAAADFSGRIAAADVRNLAAIEDRSGDEIIVALLPLARTFSRPPISGYQVGAVAGGTSGDLYLGANLEIPGQSLGLAVHAEQSALANAYMAGEAEVAAIATSSAPCGHCRQFLFEVSPKGDIRILQPKAAAAPLAVFLPDAFGPANLGMKEGMFPPRETDLKVAGDAADPLVAAALAAARKSYAPHSKSPAGVALLAGDGRIHRGSYLENAAFNPSLSPLQGALVGLVLSGGDPSAVSRACLVEAAGAAISQRSVTEAVLSAVAPAVKLQVVTAARTSAAV